MTCDSSSPTARPKPSSHQPDRAKSRSLTTPKPIGTATASSDASTSSSTSAASPRDTTGGPATTSPSSNSLPSCSGCAECRFVLDLWRVEALAPQALGHRGAAGAPVGGQDAEAQHVVRGVVLDHVIAIAALDVETERL